MPLFECALVAGCTHPAHCMGELKCQRLAKPAEGDAPAPPPTSAPKAAPESPAQGTLL